MGKKIGRIPGWLGLILIVSYILLTMLLVFVPVEPKVLEVVEPMLALIGTLSGVAAGYHFKNSDPG